MSSLLERLTRRILTGEAADGSNPYRKEDKASEEASTAAGEAEYENAGGRANDAASEGESGAALPASEAEPHSDRHVDHQSVQASIDSGAPQGGAGAYADGSTWRLALDDTGREWKIPESESNPEAVLSLSLIDEKVLVDQDAELPAAVGADNSNEVKGAGDAADPEPDDPDQLSDPDDPVAEGQRRSWLRRLCTHCWGSGQISSVATCPACQGVAQDWCEGMALACSACHGTGRINLVCSHCEGRGWLDPDEVIEEHPRPAAEEVNAVTCSSCGEGEVSAPAVDEPPYSADHYADEQDSAVSGGVTYGAEAPDPS